MPRNRILYGYIENDAARNVSLRKRRLQFLKMVWELTILCGIDACGIVYSPNEEEPVFWPSQLEVELMLRQYEAIPDMVKHPKKLNQEAYIKERINKLEKQLEQLESSNREMENSYYLHQIYRGGKTFREFMQRDLDSLKGFAEERRRALRKRMQYSHQASDATPDPEPVAEHETLIDDEDLSMEQWFINMTSETTQYEVDNNINQPPHQDPSMLGVNHGEIGASSYLTNPEGINREYGLGGAPGGLHHGNTQGNVTLYGWSQLNAGGFNVEQDETLESISTERKTSTYTWGSIRLNPRKHIIDGEKNEYFGDDLGHQGSANVINQGSVLPVGHINGNDSVGHGWLPHQGVSEGQHHGQVGGTSAHGALHFPDNNNIFSARLPSSNLMDVEQPHYVSSTSYYNDHVGGNSEGNVAPQLENHHNWPNMY